MADAAPIFDSHFSGRPDPAFDRLQSAARIAAGWPVMHRPTSLGTFGNRIRVASRALIELDRQFAKVKAADAPMSTTQLELLAHRRDLHGALIAISEKAKKIPHLPRVVYVGAQDEPRVAQLTRAYLDATNGTFCTSTFQRFVECFQRHEALTLDELWSLNSFLRFALLESLLRDAQLLAHEPPLTKVPELAARLQSLLVIHQVDWTNLIEPLITFDKWLREDPAGAYNAMDFDSRQRYRYRVASIARYSDCDEDEVAQAALDLARRGNEGRFSDPRMQNRRIHVGYYLIEQGFARLASIVGYHPPPLRRVLHVIRTYAEDFYIGGILVLSLLLLAFILFLPLPQFAHLASFILACLLLTPPVMQIAVDLINQAVTGLNEPEPLPKLDFSKGIPADCATLVAVPSLLLSERHVHELVENLEVRYLGNRDPHLHFALLTDLSDSATKPRDNDAHPFVELAVRLIGELNAKYASERKGSFLLLHRHRIYNTRQGVWMSWERKRGKLLDLNKLLTGEFDAFPIKAGPIGLLKDIRYVLTLDADTQLPHGTATRLVGAIAHPLNQAVIDPKLRIVTMGYGILQPRVGTAVRSTVRSRLAAIFSSQTGFDIYSHATSDTYQDLFGEGIFAGKGIYEVATFHAVLNHRFPRNALLSHDLIEGAYARAGLVSDVEVIDDYPSHYSAYSRRQHRWVRGDWQIAQWMFAIVPDEAGRLGPNPTSSISRWKIFDNLRRSLVDPALVFLFAAGWLGLPGGPLYWTVTSLFLTFLPSIIPFAFSLTLAIANRSKGQVLDAIAVLGRSLPAMILRLILLLHQTMLILDAVFRSLFRRFVTGQRLLEWETAAQAEAESVPRAPADRYLTIVVLVVLSLAISIRFLSSQHHALLFATPILALWALSGLVTVWLNHSPDARWPRRRADTEFLYEYALRTWRFFHVFSSALHNYLIPDNVEESGLSEAARVSPTNIGMLLNARQAACELGFLTVPEFTILTRNSLATVARLEKFCGHLYNWYDTQSLQPLGPYPFISSVDSGNFVASLYTLRSGVRDLRRRPLLGVHLFAGLSAHWLMFRSERDLPQDLRRLTPPGLLSSTGTWLEWLDLADAAISSSLESWTGSSDGKWWLTMAHHRVTSLRSLVRAYLPWILPEYRQLHSMLGLKANEVNESPSIDEGIRLCDELLLHLSDISPSQVTSTFPQSLAERLRESLLVTKNNLHELSASLWVIEQEAENLADSTDFSFLVNCNRQILSLGYYPGEDRMDETCYDLFASEARLATFLAVARGDLRPQSWFKLEREHTYAFGQYVVLSWTGTMFEYLMPALWLRSYRGTLASRTEVAAVHIQQAFAHTLRIPWGISESGRASRNDGGHYRYHAFGVPQIAISQDATAGPVVSPYATFLALGADPSEALRNLRRMESAGWVGAYGFYEAADYSESLRSPEVVKEWMAHHQGMSLLAITNLICDDIFPRWFNSTPIVQAVELLLHETPVSISVLKAQRKDLATA
jgi:cyclic beta-1,2-glucan synthetase